MRKRRSLSSFATAVAACAAAACSGSIEGTVYGTDSATPVRVTGHSVFLLSASNEVTSVLKSVCPASSADWAERSRRERARFDQLAVAYGDSARDEFALRHGGRRWTALVRAMNIYRDSAAKMDGRPPAIPGDLIEKLATNRVSTNDDGRYTFSNLPPGQYLVATDLHDEFRWIPVQVSRAKRTADITPRASQASCDVARQL
jgi:hypothetical protein